MLKRLKVARLASILANRNVISKEEYYSLVLMDDLSKFPKGAWVHRLDDKFTFGIDYIKRAFGKMIYQTGFADKIEFEYYDKILPYVRKHSLLSLWLTK